jgi:hypothetical protein
MKIRVSKRTTVEIHFMGFVLILVLLYLAFG